MKIKTLYLMLIMFSFGYSQNIDSIVVYKNKRNMFLYQNGSIIKKFKIALGKKKHPKEKEGDRRTPEGIYQIDSKNPSGKFYKNLGINYPNEIDRTKNRTGGNIKIHGIKNGFGFFGKLHRVFNWTNGCIAVTNKEMDYLFDKIKIGTLIIIKP